MQAWILRGISQKPFSSCESAVLVRVAEEQLMSLLGIMAHPVGY
jgi:hypothetical protein